jgi:hypothetical protein
MGCLANLFPEEVTREYPHAHITDNTKLAAHSRPDNGAEYGSGEVLLGANVGDA